MIASKAQKMRDKLSFIADKSREEFETKKKQLEAEMNRGRENMGKIQKGLKNNEIVDQPIISVESVDHKKHKKVRLHKTDVHAAQPIAGGSDHHLIPSGLRVSEWCFSGSLDSTPPVVKANAIYENVRLLGRGAFGDVYLVKNVDDNRLFANKTIFCEKEADMEETLREVKYLRKNRHPCIIDIHDGFITAQPRILNIITSYCEAGDLAKVITSSRKSRNNISETHLLKWSMQIALALHFLHENGFIHRDLKPCNVMLTEGGDLVKVADFGLALDLGDLGRNANSEAGTPLYTAPEMVQGLECSYPVDCWSFGVMLHELARLDLPFRSHNTGDLVRSILNDEPPPLPPHYSEELKAVSMALLDKNPATRLGFAGLLMVPLFSQKAAAFPQSYRPKACEERIRRAHTRQLTAQIETLAGSKNSSLNMERAIPKISTASLAQGDERGNQGGGERRSLASIPPKDLMAAGIAQAPSVDGQGAGLSDKASTTCVPKRAPNGASSSSSDANLDSDAPVGGGGGGGAGGAPKSVGKYMVGFSDDDTVTPPMVSSAGGGGGGGGDVFRQANGFASLRTNSKAQAPPSPLAPDMTIAGASVPVPSGTTPRGSFASPRRGLAAADKRGTGMYVFTSEEGATPPPPSDSSALTPRSAKKTGKGSRSGQDPPILVLPPLKYVGDEGGNDLDNGNSVDALGVGMDGSGSDGVAGVDAKGTNLPSLGSPRSRSESNGQRAEVKLNTLATAPASSRSRGSPRSQDAGGGGPLLTVKAITSPRNAL